MYTSRMYLVPIMSSRLADGHKSSQMVIDIAGEILREAGGKDELSLRVESSLDPAVALDLPIAEGVLEAVEIESEQAEIQPAVEDRSGA